MSAALIQELTAIRSIHGDLTSQIVVDAARPADSPLHSHFEWNDDVAAEKFRLHQAGQLLRVVFKPDPNQPVHLRAFVATASTEHASSSYVPTETALADPFTRTLILRRMEREWKSFRARYRHMTEFADLIRGAVGDVDEGTAS